jgi:hypothetical protein
MHVEHDVGAVGKVAGPERLALEAALEHDGDFAVHGFGVRDNGFKVFEDPGCAVVGEGCWGAEFGEVMVVDWLVDGGKGVGLWAS